MKTLISLTLFLSSTLAFSQHTNEEKLKSIRSLSRIAFGSCNKQNKRQVLWQGLIEQTPDLFIWNGDNVYANTNDPRRIRASYELQNKVEDYAFFKSLTPIIGTWDDHDYGNNNEDGRYPHKKVSQQFLLDFLEEPRLSERRMREGIYTSYDFVSEGKLIKILILDNRYFMNLETKFPLLGRAQWDWLQKELKNSRASLHLVVSGLSILSPKAPASEEWADYEEEKNRLRLLMKASGKPYLYLTGDKHFSSIFRSGDELEFMASGMTHNTRLPLRPYVRAKYPNPVFENNYGMIDISWEKDSPVLDLNIKSSTGESLNSKRVRWMNTSWNNI